jgi:hypothetical protein
MKEQLIEIVVCKFAKDHGILATKLSGPNEKGRPDRMFLHQGKAAFIEFKAPGKKPTALQMKWLLDLKYRGFAATWVDNVADGVGFLDTELMKK